MCVIATSCAMLNVSLDHAVKSVRLLIPGDGDAPEGLRRAAQPLQSDHVLSRSAAALHQCQERPGSAQSEIKDEDGEKEEEYKENK